MIDSIFINKFKHDSYSVYSLINAQVFGLSNIILPGFLQPAYFLQFLTKTDHKINMHV
jgi:hypothetical protein